MCKDEVRAEFDLVRTYMDCELKSLSITGLLPVSCTQDSFHVWLEKRNATKHRKHLQEYLNSIGCKDIIRFIELTHGISINDCFWIRLCGEDVSWDNVSPYRNDYDGVIQKLSFEGCGICGVALSSTSPEFWN